MDGVDRRLCFGCLVLFCVICFSLGGKTVCQASRGMYIVKCKFIYTLVGLCCNFFRKRTDDVDITVVGDFMAFTTTMLGGRSISLAEKLAKEIWNGSDGNRSATLFMAELIWWILLSTLGYTVFSPGAVVVTKTRCLLCVLQNVYRATRTRFLLASYSVEDFSTDAVRGNVFVKSYLAWYAVAWFATWWGCHRKSLL